MDSAVIFDVDGVLLDLTPQEEDAFFIPFARRHGLTGLSRDWDSYRVRSDEHIVAEILERHGLPPEDRDGIFADYLALLSEGLGSGALQAMEIPGTRDLLASLPESRLGIATANLLSAAKLRLASRNLWQPVSGLAFGAEGSGHKRETVARAIEATGLPRERIVYIGDNLNDVEAGLANGVHFIGFSLDAARRERLGAAGASHLSGDHVTTRRLIGDLLG
ncbi:HAD family hydrolase [Aestuariivirga sp.]|uniref:HAD family hydrolase n=1 Tax=Aestuariivirga sp. TaxID=2650926 RepID=UPI00391AC360